MGRRFGRGGRVLGGVRIGGELTEAERREYQALAARLTSREKRWMRQQRGDADERPREPVVVEVHAARDGVRGRKEYYIEWSDGREGWEARPQSVSREVARRMATERAEYERAEAAGETMGLREMLIRQRGEGWMWLAAEAPKAVGRRDVRALVAEVKERGLHRGIAEEGGMEGAEAAVMEAEREAEAAREEVVARQRAAEAERGAMEARAEAATAARRAAEAWELKEARRLALAAELR